VLLTRDQRRAQLPLLHLHLLEHEVIEIAGDEDDLAVDGNREEEPVGLLAFGGGELRTHQDLGEVDRLVLVVEALRFAAGEEEPWADLEGEGAILIQIATIIVIEGETGSTKTRRPRTVRDQERVTTPRGSRRRRW